MLALLAVLSRRTGLTTEDLLRRYGEFLFSRFVALYPGFSNTRKKSCSWTTSRGCCRPAPAAVRPLCNGDGREPSGSAAHARDHADIAVIVADMRMLEMSGIELLGVIRSRWPEIRRIMLTGNTD